MKDHICDIDIGIHVYIPTNKNRFDGWDAHLDSSRNQVGHADGPGSKYEHVHDGRIPEAILRGEDNLLLLRSGRDLTQQKRDLLWKSQGRNSLAVKWRKGIEEDPTDDGSLVGVDLLLDILGFDGTDQCPVHIHDQVLDRSGGGECDGEGVSGQKALPITDHG